MLKSKDGTIEIYQAKSPSDLVFTPAAWSVVNIPADSEEASLLFKNLYQTVATRHIMLGLCRHKRKDRPWATMNLPKESWTYLETVSLWYEKPSTCSNNGFLPLAEPGWLYYKGDVPNTKNTAWFLEDYNNATNLWNLAPQAKEPSENIYYQKFSWEMNLLLMSLAKPLESKKFIYTLPLDKNEQMSLFEFCHTYGLVACLYSSEAEESKEIFDNYSKYLENKK